MGRMPTLRSCLQSRPCAAPVQHYPPLMRELPLLAALAIAALLGFGLGFICSRPAAGPVTVLPPTGPAPAGEKSSVTRIVGTLDVEAMESSPVTTANTWKPGEKEALVQHVEKLSKSDADYLCLTLGLIPTDEVFDKVNVKGRLVRYINGLSGPSELRDFDSAFRQLANR